MDGGREDLEESPVVGILCQQRFPIPGCPTGGQGEKRWEMNPVGNDMRDQKIVVYQKYTLSTLAHDSLQMQRYPIPSVSAMGDVPS